MRRVHQILGGLALQTRKADVETDRENRPKTDRYLMPRTQDDFTTSRWRFRARKTRSRLRLRTRTPRRPSEKKYAAATKNSLPALNRKKVPLPPFFNQSRLCLTNCLICDCVRVRASECYAKTTEQFLKGAFPHHFVDLYRIFVGRRCCHVTAPMFEIGINVSKDIRSLGKCFLTIVRIEDQWFLSGNKLETFIHDTLNATLLNCFLSHVSRVLRRRALRNSH